MNDHYPSNGPSARTLRLQQTDLDHHMHPFTEHHEMAGEGGPRVIMRAEGVYLWDPDGNRLLDGMAGLWCVNVGYGRAELIEAAQRQMQELPFYNWFGSNTFDIAPDIMTIAKGLSSGYLPISGSIIGAKWPAC